jgi:hypothetical protein
LDKLIVLNEIQSLLSLGLQSKEGALRDLGEEFPEAKLQEIRQELIDDAVADGAFRLIQTEIENEIMTITGGAAAPDATPGAPAAAGAPAGQEAAAPSAPQPILDPATLDNVTAGEANLRQRLVTQAYGTRLPQRQVPQDYEK